MAFRQKIDACGENAFDHSAVLLKLKHLVFDLGFDLFEPLLRVQISGLAGQGCKVLHAFRRIGHALVTRCFIRQSFMQKLTFGDQRVNLREALFDQRKEHICFLQGNGAKNHIRHFNHLPALGKAQKAETPSRKDPNAAEKAQVKSVANVDQLIGAGIDRSVVKENGDGTECRQRADDHEP
jgi:hypothetical protein